MAQGKVVNPETDSRVKKNVETLTRLREAAAIDCTWAECAFFAGISEKTMYEWFKDGDEGKKLREDLEALRNKPILKARKEVVKGLTNYQNAMDYLSRKRKAEFSTKVEQEQTITVVDYAWGDPNNLHTKEVGNDPAQQ